MKKIILNFSLLIAVAITIESCGPTGIVVSARPEPPVYVRPVSPNAGYVWIDGEWIWRGNQYVYRNGYWGPPRGHRIYTSGHWEQHRGGWHWRSGYWR